MTPEASRNSEQSGPVRPVSQDCAGATPADPTCLVQGSRRKTHRPIEVGDEFGRLTVIGAVFRKYASGASQRKASFCECLCQCGKTSVVRTDLLKTGVTKSCGCYNIAVRSTQDGRCRTHPYLVRLYYRMLERCYRRSNQNYADYGGRGIRVCEEWLGSPAAFYEWCLSNGYEKKLQIDRRENDGPYSPENCRFVTPKENSNNRRSSRRLSFNGEMKTVSEWAEHLGIKREVLNDRLNKSGWSVEKTLTTPYTKRSANGLDTAAGQSPL